MPFRWVKIVKEVISNIIAIKPVQSFQLLAPIQLLQLWLQLQSTEKLQSQALQTNPISQEIYSSHYAHNSQYGHYSHYGIKGIMVIAAITAIFVTSAIAVIRVIRDSTVIKNIWEYLATAT